MPPSVVEVVAGVDVHRPGGELDSAHAIAEVGGRFAVGRGRTPRAAAAAAAAALALGRPVEWMIGEGHPVEEVITSRRWRTAIEWMDDGYRAVTVGPRCRAGVAWSTSKAAAVARATLNSRDDEEGAAVA